MLRLACGAVACLLCAAPWLNLSPFDVPMLSLVLAACIALIGFLVPRLLKASSNDDLARAGAALCALALLACVATIAFVARFGVALD